MEVAARMLEGGAIPDPTVRCVPAGIVGRIGELTLRQQGRRDGKWSVRGRTSTVVEDAPARMT